MKVIIEDEKLTKRQVDEWLNKVKILSGDLIPDQIYVRFYPEFKGKKPTCIISDDLLDLK